MEVGRVEVRVSAPPLSLIAESDVLSDPNVLELPRRDSQYRDGKRIQLTTLLQQ
jgi:hypothetical protein